ncbi:MAG: hypothetical protein RLN62_01870 [Rickettsiales bacterium]
MSTEGVKVETVDGGMPKTTSIYKVTAKDIKDYAKALHGRKPFKGDIVKFLRRNRRGIAEGAIFSVEDVELKGTSSKPLDLSGIDLSNCMFGGNITFENVNLDGADLSDSNGYGTHHLNLKMKDCSAIKIDLSNRFPESAFEPEMDIENVDFAEANVTGCTFRGPNQTFKNVNFAEATLADTYFYDFTEDDSLFKPYKDKDGNEHDPFKNVLAINVDTSYDEASPALMAAIKFGKIVREIPADLTISVTSSSSFEEIDRAVIAEQMNRHNGKRTDAASKAMAGASEATIKELLDREITSGFTSSWLGSVVPERVEEIKKALAEALVEKIGKDDNFLLSRDMPELLKKLTESLEVSDSELDHGALRNIVDDLKAAPSGENIKPIIASAVRHALGELDKANKESRKGFNQQSFIKKVVEQRKEEGKRHSAGKTISKFMGRAVKKRREAAERELLEAVTGEDTEIIGAQKVSDTAGRGAVALAVRKAGSTYVWLVNQTGINYLKRRNIGEGFITSESEHLVNDSASAKRKFDLQMLLPRLVSGGVLATTAVISGAALLSGGGALAALAPLALGGATTAATEVGGRLLTDSTGVIPGQFGDKLFDAAEVADITIDHVADNSGYILGGAAIGTLVAATGGAAGVAFGTVPTLASAVGGLTAGITTGAALGTVTGGVVAAHDIREEYVASETKKQALRKKHNGRIPIEEVFKSQDETREQRPERSLSTKMKNILLFTGVTLLAVAAAAFCVGTFGLGIPVVTVAGAISAYAFSSIGLAAGAAVAAATYKFYDRLVEPVVQMKKYMGLAPKKEKDGPTKSKETERTRGHETERASGVTASPALDAERKPIPGKHAKKEGRKAVNRREALAEQRASEAEAARKRGK